MLWYLIELLTLVFTCNSFVLTSCSICPQIQQGLPIHWFLCTCIPRADLKMLCNNCFYFFFQLCNKNTFIWKLSYVPLLTCNKIWGMLHSTDVEKCWIKNISNHEVCLELWKCTVVCTMEQLFRIKNEMYGELKYNWCTISFQEF